MTQEQIKSKLINLYESDKDKVCERIEKIFQTNLEVESIFDDFLYLKIHEVNQIYNYIWDNFKDFICLNEEIPLQTNNILICFDWWEHKGDWGDLKFSTIKIIFSDKFVKFIKEILNERDIDHEIRNFGY